MKWLIIKIVGNFLKLITKNSLLFGESNNLELGLHVLNFYQGDFENSIKTFLNDTIDVPDDCPILTYNYNGNFLLLFKFLKIWLNQKFFYTETEIWSNEEIKKFEEAILVHDKNFSEIAGEVISVFLNLLNNPDNIDSNLKKGKIKINQAMCRVLLLLEESFIRWYQEKVASSQEESSRGAEHDPAESSLE